MSVEKRTPLQWTEYLAQEHSPVTITEYMAGCLSRLLGAQLAATQAAEHTEGMVGAIDQFAAAMAQHAGLPYAASGKVRAALDAQRDEERAKILARAYDRLGGASLTDG